MSELIERLRQLDGSEDISQKRTIFHTQILHLPLAMFEENCLAYVLEKYLQYGFRLNFFISLPRSLRMAMQKALKAQQAIPTVQSYAQELQVHLNHVQKFPNEWLYPLHFMDNRCRIRNRGVVYVRNYIKSIRKLRKCIFKK